MKLLAFVLYFFTFIPFCLSQGQPIRPFEQIDYIGLNTQWHHTFFDSNAVGNYDGYNQFNSSYIAGIDGDYVYVVLNRQEVKGPSGYYIMKSSMIDGSIAWSTQFGYPNTDKAEMLRDFHINDDGNIECFAQEFPDLYLEGKDGFGSRNMIFVHRVMDNDNGSILSESKGDSKSDDSFRSHFTFFYRGNLNQFYRKGKDDYDFWEYHAYPSKPKHWVRSRVSSQSKKTLTQSDSIQLVAFPTLIPPYQIANDQYVLFEYKLGINKLIMRRIDNNLKVLATDSTPVLGNKLVSLDIIGYDAEKKIFLMSNEVEVSDLLSPHDLLWIGLDGVLHRQVHLNAKYDSSFKVIDWTKNSALVLAKNTYSERVITSLDLLEIRDSVLSINKRWMSTDTLRTVAGFDIKNMNNSDDRILLWGEFSHALNENNSPFRDFNASAVSLLRISNDELLVSIDGTKAGPNDNHLLIYPSPTRNTLKIRSASSISKVTIRDTQGKLVYSTNNGYSSELILDVSSLLIGVYVVTVHNGVDTLQNIFVKM